MDNNNSDGMIVVLNFFNRLAFDKISADGPVATKTLAVLEKTLSAGNDSSFDLVKYLCENYPPSTLSKFKIISELINKLIKNIFLSDEVSRETKNKLALIILGQEKEEEERTSNWGLAIRTLEDFLTGTIVKGDPFHCKTASSKQQIDLAIKLSYVYPYSIVLQKEKLLAELVDNVLEEVLFAQN